MWGAFLVEFKWRRFFGTYMNGTYVNGTYVSVTKSDLVNMRPSQQGISTFVSGSTTALIGLHVLVAALS